MITSVQQRAAGRKVWFAQSNFLPATISRHFVPCIVLYYCSNLVKNLSLSLKQSDIERKELKKAIFSQFLWLQESWGAAFLSLMRTDRSVIFRLQIILLMMPADYCWSSSCKRVVVSDLIPYTWYGIAFPEGNCSAAAKHKKVRCNTDDDKVVFF